MVLLLFCCTFLQGSYHPSQCRGKPGSIQGSFYFRNSSAPAPWDPFNRRAVQWVRLEEQSVCVVIEARGHEQVNGVKFWRCLVQSPSQSRTTLAWISCGFIWLSLENLQGWRCHDFSGKYSPMLPTCLAKHCPTSSSQACYPCN